MNRFWLKNRLVVWLFMLLLPPLGIALLWMRHDSRVLTKLAGSLAAILFIVLHLVIFWNLRVELNGGLTRPYLSFRNSEKHNEEIEKLRVEEQSIDTSGSHAPLPAVVGVGDCEIVLILTFLSRP